LETIEESLSSIFLRLGVFLGRNHHKSPVLFPNLQQRVLRVFNSLIGSPSSKMLSFLHRKSRICRKSERISKVAIPCAKLKVLKSSLQIAAHNSVSGMLHFRGQMSSPDLKCTYAGRATERNFASPSVCFPSLLSSPPCAALCGRHSQLGGVVNHPHPSPTETRLKG